MQIEIYQRRPTLDDLRKGDRGETSLYFILNRLLDAETAIEIAKAATQYEFTMLAIQMPRNGIKVIYEHKEGAHIFDAREHKKLTVIQPGDPVRFTISEATALEKAAIEQIKNILEK